MGIRSLLRNAFGRSRAARNEPTVPEARAAEPSAAAQATPAGEGASAGEPPTGTAPEREPSSTAESASLLAAFDASAAKPVAAPEREQEPEEEPASEPAPLPAQAKSAAPASATGEPAAEAPAAPVEPKPEPEAKPESESKPESASASAAEPAAAEGRPDAEESTTASVPAQAASPEPRPESPEASTPPQAPAVPAQAKSVKATQSTGPTKSSKPAEEPPAATVPAQAAAKPEDAKTGTEPAVPAQPESAPTAEPAAPGSAGIPAQPGPAADGPRISLAKVEATAPALVSLYKSAASALQKQGLAGRRAAVYLVLDRSGSMRRYYKDGTVQHLAEQALGLSANLDDDGTVPIVFFSTEIDGTADISLDDHSGRIETLHAGLGHMGRTNYHCAIEAVVEHYGKSGSTAPAFVIFQTDGAPTSKPAAEKALCDAAKLPIFWQFVGFGEQEAKGFDFLRKLDDLAVPDKRPVDNAGFFSAGTDPLLLTDDDLYSRLTDGFPQWLAAAREAGILR
ncbi:VWA domain-containing protein [Streptomyces sp. NPDC004647]|uniref:vWA domain-containing protein n=1 Tax=Streptomyces sp. NPDC004647 TaxID=3154671 RepID=UPI0033B50CDE